MPLSLTQRSKWVKWWIWTSLMFAWAGECHASYQLRPASQNFYFHQLELCSEYWAEHRYTGAEQYSIMLQPGSSASLPCRQSRTSAAGITLRRRASIPLPSVVKHDHILNLSTCRDMARTQCVRRDTLKGLLKPYDQYLDCTCSFDSQFFWPQLAC